MVCRGKILIKSRSHIVTITLLAMVSAMASAIVGTSAYAKSGKTKKVPLVVVEKAQLQSVIKQVPLSGTVTSPKVGRLSSEVSGRVKSIKVEIGDKVKKGDTLIQLDREIQTLNLKAIQAATQKSREELAEARRRYESGKRLSKQNSISKEEFEQRLAAVKIADAALQQQQAIEHKQQAVVNRHSINAPFSGVISKKLTEIGEWVDTGKPVLTLVAMDNLKLDFQVPQEYYGQVNSSSQIHANLDALPTNNLDVSIDAIVPVSDPDARTFLIRTKLEKPSINITPGMSVQGILRLNTGTVGVIVSRDAIVRYRDGRITVWVVHIDGEVPKVKEQSVKVGHSFNGKVSIMEGLQADTVVVVEGNEGLKQGQAVQVHSSR